MTSFREKLFDHIQKKYKASEERLWKRYPNYVVCRHKDNQKWFVLVMDIPKNKLGMDGDEIVDIVNVKISDAFLADILVQQEGFFRGYHISRGNWLSILLDGTVPFGEICKWVEESFMTTASKETRHRLRPPKEWLIPANPKYYDVQEAFRQEKEINWKQGRGIKTGDTVYMYVAAPVSAILYKCLVTQTDIPFRSDTDQIRIKKLMRIRLLKQYREDRFTFDILGKDYGIFAVRGPRGIPDSLSEALK